MKCNYFIPSGCISQMEQLYENDHEIIKIEIL